MLLLWYGQDFMRAGRVLTCVFGMDGFYRAGRNKVSWLLVVLLDRMR